MSAANAPIAELLADGPTSSFEFFPPRDEAGLAQLMTAIDELHDLKPDFVSVTYGANGSSRDRTIHATRLIAKHTDFRVVGHLTCTGQTVDQLKEALDAYADAGVRHILAIRGDMPGGPTVPWEPVKGGLRNATELVDLVMSRGKFDVGVAAFPDVHPNGSAELDAQILVDKADAGATFAVTQLFFDPTRYAALVDRVREKGCDLPIIGGIMPVTAYSQVAKFAELSGADLPEPIVARLQAVADDSAQLREIGVEIGVELATALLAAGAPGLQFFTQNRSRATREILSRLQAARR